MSQLKRKANNAWVIGILVSITLSARGHESFASKEIGPKGGTIALQNSRVMAIIPSGALTESHNLQIVETTGSVIVQRGQDPVITHIYKFLPSIVFLFPAKIRFYCDKDCPKIAPNGSWSLTVGRVLPDGRTTIEPDDPLPEGTHSFGQRLVPEEKYVELSTVNWHNERILMHF